MERINDLEIIKKIAPPPPPPLFRVKIYENSISIWDYTVKNLDEDFQNSEVSKKAGESLKGTGEKYMASIFVYDNVSEDRVNSMQKVMQEVGMRNVKARRMK